MNLSKLYRQLLRQHGLQQWWPVVGPEKTGAFEICVGAILTQNTVWTNVEKVIRNLIESSLMSSRTIAECPLAKLARLIKPSGYFNQKAKKLKIFSQWLIKKYDGDLKKFFKQPLPAAREELLSLWGIGPETADSMLLYAGHKPIFVIDAYTKRFCAKHGVVFNTYDEYQKFFQNGLKVSPPQALCKLAGPPLAEGSRFRIYNEFHALIVKWGKDGRE